MKRLGLYGGSFDPVHLGHLLVARAAMEELQLDRLFFIPAAQSPLKPERQPAPANFRLQMLRLALVGETRYEIDLQEIDRGGASYTIDTLRDYAQRFPKAQLYYLIGADNASQLHRWRESDQFARLAEFVVIPRPGGGDAELPPPFRGQALRGFPLGVSSSEIRGRIKAGLPVDLLVPPAVAEAIRVNRLYV